MEIQRRLLVLMLKRAMVNPRKPFATKLVMLFVQKLVKALFAMMAMMVSTTMMMMTAVTTKEPSHSEEIKLVVPTGQAIAIRKSSTTNAPKLAAFVIVQTFQKQLI